MTSLLTATPIANWIVQHGVPVHGAVSLHATLLSTLRVTAPATLGANATLAIHAAAQSLRPIAPVILHLARAARRARPLLPES